MLSVLGLIPVPPGRIVSGEAMFKGEDLLKMPEDGCAKIRGGAIAMIFQDPMTSLNPVLTIGDQIAEAIKVHNPETNAAGARKRTIELLELVGVPFAERRVEQYPHEFSGGMRQRAMIAMAIANDPSVLIADEPTTALDVTIQAQIVEVLKAAQRETHAATSSSRTTSGSSPSSPTASSSCTQGESSSSATSSRSSIRPGIRTPSGC